MSTIRVTSTPPGREPEEIRKQWIGITIPLATREEIAQDPPSDIRLGDENRNGYLVLREKAILALRASDRREAAEFWASLPAGRYLEFKNDACDLRNEDMT